MIENQPENKKYNVLIYGAGAREHALAYKMTQSNLLEKLFLALPNDGFKNLGEEIIFSDFEDLAKKCVEKSVDLAVIGPEIPLSQEIVDIFNKYKISCIGATKKWVKLESSKKFAKEFMVKHGIPTAKYFLIDSETKIDSILEKFSTPPVIKADGLAAGKGVYLSENMNDAKECLQEFLRGKWGEASASAIVEEKLEGEELSIISLFDGKTLLPFVPARDYKRLYDNQKGPNTGGMGAFCPVELTVGQKQDLESYIKKLEFALKSEQADFVGVVYSGLMLTNAGIKVLEFNMRFGDPETQVLMLNLKSDLLEIFIKAIERKLSEIALKWESGASVCVVIASEGYPEAPKIGAEIRNIEKACEKDETQKFYAGVKIDDEKIFSSGGRVLSICKTALNVENAREKIYKTINEIEFEDKIYRKDIGL